LATIDQYFATSTRPRWQQWCNIKLAHRLTTVSLTIWILHAIPSLVFNNYVISPLTNQITCQVTSAMYNQYMTYGYYLTLSNLLPLITVVFGLMAYHNARNLAHRAVPLVRLELDKQLTVMVLVQVFINFCTRFPLSIIDIFQTISTNQTDPVIQAKENFASIVFSDFSILSYTVRVLSKIFYPVKC
jgi:hypothetical protein